MFDASLVTRMTDWRNTEFDNKIFSLTILNNMHIEIFMYFLLYRLECVLELLLLLPCDKYLINIYVLKLCTHTVNFVIHKWISPVLHM